MRRIIGGIVGGGIAVFGGAQAMDDDTTRNDSGEIVEGGGLGVLAMDVGDCVQLPTDHELVQSVEGVPCGEPHDAELYAEFDVPDGAFPGDPALEKLAGEGCYERWGSAVGTVYEDDKVLDFTFFLPSEQGWAEGDREVQCMVLRIDGTRLTAAVLG